MIAEENDCNCTTFMLSSPYNTKVNNFHLISWFLHRLLEKDLDFYSIGLSTDCKIEIEKRRMVK